VSIFQVGRAFDGVDVDVSALSLTGDALSVSGSVILGAVTAANRPGVGAALRDRVSALMVPQSGGEPQIVPVVWSEDSSVDGYYVVRSASFTPSTLSAIEGSGSWQIELQRFGGGSVPQCEVYGKHAARTNSHSITTTTLNGSTDYRRIGVPAAAVDFWSGAQSTAVTRTSATGALSMWYLGNYPQANTATYTVGAADFYDGACELRTTYGSATSQLVTGLYCPPAFDGMVLSNGLVRAFLHPSTATAFEVEVYDGSQWEDVSGGVGWRIEHDYGGGPSTQSWDLSAAKVTVIENSPIRVTIRLMLPEAATLNRFGRVWVDLSVRRGDPFVCGWVRTDEAGLVALEPTSSIAATALTGGIRATSNDAAGNRAVWGLANGSPSNNLTTGRITQTVGTTLAPFMVGVEIAGSSSSTIADDQAILYQFYDVRAESLRVVRR